ncbi:hypothetical protein HCZ02_09265 [Limosilactobacillus fermentum]
MKEIVIAVVSSLFGGALGAFFNYKGKTVSAIASQEDVYADHTKELFKRLDKLTDERDELKDQVLEQSKTIDILNGQIKQLRQDNERLIEQVRKLTEKVNDLVKADTELEGATTK